MIIHQNWTTTHWTWKTKHLSLQRCLQNTFLKTQKNHLSKQAVLEVATQYSLKADTLDLSGHPTYLLDAEGEWGIAGKYETVLCFNYLLLSKNPEKVIKNIEKALKPNGVAIVDFISLTYFYKASDGHHFNQFNLNNIETLMKNFKQVEIYPLGNFFQAAMNYYSKFSGSKLLGYLLKFIGAWLGQWDHSELSAIHYIAIGIK